MKNQNKKTYSKLHVFTAQPNRHYVVAEGYVSKSKEIVTRTIKSEKGDELPICSVYMNLINQAPQIDRVLEEMDADLDCVFTNTDSMNTYTAIKITGFGKVANRMAKALVPGCRVLVSGYFQINKWQNDADSSRRALLVINVSEFWVTRYPEKTESEVES